MPTSLLSKFGVPLGGGRGRGGLIQPKFTNRFRVRVSHFGPISGGLDLTQQVQSVKKPSVKWTPVVIDSYNSRAYYAGKHEFDPIELIVKDDITNSVTRLITHQMQKQLNFFEQTAYESGINYKFLMYIETMDGGNDIVLDAWVLEGCMLNTVTFAPLDYKDANMQLITMTIQCDSAVMTGGLQTFVPDFIPGITVS
jgi:hypothetical protein